MCSEFLYLKRDGLPGEEEQVSAYREVIRQMKGKRTVIRTLDFGARKLTELPKNKPEMNPSLGFRSIRHLPCHAADVSDPAAGNLSGQPAMVRSASCSRWWIV